MLQKQRLVDDGIVDVLRGGSLPLRELFVGPSGGFVRHCTGTGVVIPLAIQPC
ncbi:MAG: hypothetical protein L6Q57_04780 [Alphaproteobacteria bacterium]|nr:hypothetical protein [Alphaproteobacteria bacterium]